jgi:hypothetical protein
MTLKERWVIAPGREDAGEVAALVERLRVRPNTAVAAVDAALMWFVRFHGIKMGRDDVLDGSRDERCSLRLFWDRSAIFTLF